MKILWVVNIMLPEIAKHLGLPYSNREGWLTGIFGEFLKKKDEFSLCVAFPADDKDLVGTKFDIDGIECRAFYEDLSHPEYYVKELEGVFKKMIKEVDPDVMHVSGTEFPHALSAVRAFNNKNRTVISIQGICRKIAEDYMAMLPSNVSCSISFRDLVRKDWMRVQRRKFYLRAVSETEALRLSGNVIGRTSFDREAVTGINEEIRYFCVNETMRPEFYEGSWDVDKASKHTIFTGQGDYPIKGLHFLIKACGLLVKKYPDLTLRIAGNSIIESGTFKQRLKLPSYGKYLRKLISENGLEGHVVTTGPLKADEMKNEYLSSSVFVLPSYIENSPNTLAEAMLLGVPVVTSDAGGIKDMISEEEGFIFERGNYEQMAGLIKKVWESEDNDPLIIRNLVKKCRDRAFSQHNGEKNLEELFKVYEEIGR
ncbi:MAG: glycosyltransferase family 4 protein [Lachnospiraceae bacterium]|nr:glycosyltransferase family 4 protein [Lachnospiraceae bacterium]